MLQINDAAFHSARILLDIEAGSPIILVPHSSLTTDVLVADLGTLSVKNCFKFDGDVGTFSEAKSGQSENTVFMKTELSRIDSQMSQKSDGITSRSSIQTLGGLRLGTASQGLDSVLQSELTHPLTQSIFDELQPPKLNFDLMTESIYGSLDHDSRNEMGSDAFSSEVVDDIYDPTDKIGTAVPQEGSSVDPVLPRMTPRSSRRNLLLDTSFDRSTTELLKPPSSPALLRSCSSISDACLKDRNVFSQNKDLDLETGSVAMDSSRHQCLLDVLEVKLSDMDLFSAERIDKRLCNKKNLHQELEFPSFIVQRTVSTEC